MLVGSRADPTLQDVTLRTPLDLAECNNHAEVINFSLPFREWFSYSKIFEGPPREVQKIG